MNFIHFFIFVELYRNFKVKTSELFRLNIQLSKVDCSNHGFGLFELKNKQDLMLIFWFVLVILVSAYICVVILILMKENTSLDLVNRK